MVEQQLSTLQQQPQQVFLLHQRLNKRPWLRGLWQQVIAGVATPWNLPIIPSPDTAWDFTVAPAAPQASQYVTQGATPTVNSMIAKVGTALLGTNDAPIAGNVGPVVSIT